MIPPSEYLTEEGIYCVTMEMVKKYHPDDVEQFCRWMTGQTGMVLRDGTCAIYAWDYERWLREGRKNEQNPLTWD